MKTVQLKKTTQTDWEYLSEKKLLQKPLVLVFGNRYMLEDANLHSEICSLFPDGEFVFGSTAGDITSQYVDDETISITAIEFEKSNYVIKTANMLDNEAKKDSYETGKNLIQQFDTEGLKHVFIVFKAMASRIFNCDVIVD